MPFDEQNVVGSLDAVTTSACLLRAQKPAVSFHATGAPTRSLANATYGSPAYVAGSRRASVSGSWRGTAAFYREGESLCCNGGSLECGAVSEPCERAPGARPPGR